MRSAEYDVFDFAVLWNKDAPGAAYFELTPQKFLFLFVIGLVAFISVLIAHRTIDFNRSSYTNLLMIIILGMNGMLIVSTDLFSLYVFMEITGICCFVMIAMFRSRRRPGGIIQVPRHVGACKHFHSFGTRIHFHENRLPALC